MRTGTITVAGTEYTLCLSTSLMVKLEEQNGGTAGDALDQILDEGRNGRIGPLFGLLADMIAAGTKYKRLIGEFAPDPISKEDLQDLIGPDDYQEIFGRMHQTVTGGRMPEVIVESKNAEASPGE